MAHYSGHAPSRLGPDAAEIAQRLAIRHGSLRFPRRIAPGPKAGAPSPAAAGEPLMGAIPVSAREGYALWADTWDATPSPIVALERRALLPWILGLHPRRAIDVGCGTGRWTERLSAIGVDDSPAMLAIAAGKARSTVLLF